MGLVPPQNETAAGLPAEPLRTRPSSAQMAAQVTAYSWPVRMARGVVVPPLGKRKKKDKLIQVHAGITSPHSEEIASNLFLIPTMSKSFSSSLGIGPTTLL